MISPTGRGIRRKDKWGEGRYGASRGGRLHKGTDYVCEPGQAVVAPISGIVMRKARPYPKSKYSGALIRGISLTVKMFYFKLDGDLIGEFVHIGNRIGIAQDISEKYPGMTPHVHLEIDSIDPELLVMG